MYKVKLINTVDNRINDEVEEETLVNALITMRNLINMNTFEDEVIYKVKNGVLSAIGYEEICILEER